MATWLTWGPAVTVWYGPGGQLAALLTAGVPPEVAAVFYSPEFVAHTITEVESAFGIAAFDYDRYDTGRFAT